MDWFETDPYILLLTLVGALILALAGLPLMIRRLPLSMPVILLGVGGVLTTVSFEGVWPHPRRYPEATERLAEFLVLVSLMGAGLKLDTPVGWRRWQTTWRLLGITMPLSIAAIALLGWGVLGLAPASAMLLGAVLAPTDPVLASDVQVGPPGAGDEHHVRFALTSEAGLNDGLAFPFVNLAIAMALHGPAPGIWLLEWLALDVVWKLAAGVAVGWAAGRIAGRLLFRLPYGPILAETKDGFVAVGLTLLAYGLTELVHGYGFLGVFVAAVTLRAAERNHEYHQHLHHFSMQVERLTLAGLLLLFGASFAANFLELITPLQVGTALAVLLVVRPVAGLLGLAGRPEPLSDRLAIGFFGIRGIGSFYYLAYALTATEFAEEELLWTMVALIVVLSILIHGLTATPAMSRLAGRRSAG
ncbi:MAG TPA: cation:proton antiporter [Geminicoccaceae bacterium]|nr:cation:proton antiporter [Geminicoccaceae bacterium]